MPPSKNSLKKERVYVYCSSTSAYRGSGRLSSRFWPIMNSCRWWRGRWTATLKIPKEIQRNRLRHVHWWLSATAMFTFLLSSHDSLGCQDFVPRAHPNLDPRTIRCDSKNGETQGHCGTMCPFQERDLRPCGQHDQQPETQIILAGSVVLVLIVVPSHFLREKWQKRWNCYILQQVVVQSV